MDGGEVKPLHVQVAEALEIPDVGWYYRQSEFDAEWVRSELGATGAFGLGDWYCCWDENAKGPRRIVPRYDLDWSATGPLIERFKIDVNYFTREPEAPWGASVAGSVPDEPYGWGATPLMAVCNLILALAEAGELPK